MRAFAAFCAAALLPAAVAADCVSMTNVRWSALSSHALLVRAGFGSYVLKVPYCFVSSASTVAIEDAMICGYGQINIDGES